MIPRPPLRPPLLPPVHVPGQQKKSGGSSVSTVGLAKFKNGGISGKTATFWGDSTWQLALNMWDIINDELVLAGGAWAGLNCVNLGLNGQTMAGASSAEVAATNPDLILLRFGLNDVRLGGVDATTMANRVITKVEEVRALRPNCCWVLCTPNSMLSTDPGATGYVVPLASAQAYTTVLWDAFEQIKARWNQTVPLDLQVQLFGKVCQPTSTLMTDILHPSNAGQVGTLTLLQPIVQADPVPINLTASAAAWGSNPTHPELIYSRAWEDTRFATLVKPLVVTNYTDLGAEVLIYMGAAFTGPAIFPADFQVANRAIWQPTGTYNLTGSEGVGVIGDGVQIYSGIAKSAFPVPPLKNGKLYQRL